jgi:transposase-like protein
MAKKKYRISKEVKDQTIGRIKNDGVSVSQAEEDAGISTVTIYSWLGTRARGVISLLEHNKIKKENRELKEIIGELTIRMSTEAKKGLSRS